jgi:hypothetical protein
VGAKPGLNPEPDPPLRSAMTALGCVDHLLKANFSLKLVHGARDICRHTDQNPS